ncbi:winged helix-turn-helix domain-containing protein [Microtetraspora niveoalba]|uniref:winged helix-turn-helix domain-containing protein n=1 Tax=Microtetraspora niveoalba TaxID=46175 RepID=UPI0008302742|nr:winged helix-turn-helix domain-containing protein [Microtetraspora niveoalba]
MIEWRDDLPRWRQIATVIQRRITSGEYPPGRLISENGLMQEFGVARNTARKTIVWLREEKALIYTRPNLGSFVGPEPEDDGEE